MRSEQEQISQDIKGYLKAHENKDMLRFLTCGSVDDGKSTLIGRMLYDAQKIFADQLSAVESESKKYGTTGDNLDLALLVDGLQSEREQGITIDVAYRFFNSETRKYIIADTPGHAQYTRNMVTGASTSEAAIVLIDARKGLLTQTKRHSFIVNLLGIKHVIVAVNKMDLVDYSQEVFAKITNNYNILAEELGMKNISYIPLSALAGDNVVNKSSKMPWYEGPPLLQLLDSLEGGQDLIKQDFRLPVQYVNRPDANFRGYCGSIASGTVKVGDEITVLPSGKSTKVKRIIDAGSVEVSGSDKRKQPQLGIDQAHAPMSVTLLTEDEVDIGRGDILVHSASLPRVSNAIKVMLVWMDEAPLQTGQDYDFKIGSALIPGQFEHINYRVDPNTYKRERVADLQLNDIASCKMVLSRPIVADKFSENRATGRFIVIDRHSNNTVGAGLIVNVAKRQDDQTIKFHRQYTKAEIELNRYIRQNFPEWNCKEIS